MHNVKDFDLEDGPFFEFKKDMALKIFWSCIPDPDLFLCTQF